MDSEGSMLDGFIDSELFLHFTADRKQSERKVLITITFKVTPPVTYFF
jgi:hypothetical protein